jgi:hypothetical protein
MCKELETTIYYTSRIGFVACLCILVTTIPSYNVEDHSSEHEAYASAKLFAVIPIYVNVWTYHSCQFMNNYNAQVRLTSITQLLDT